MNNLRVIITENEMTATLAISKSEPYPERSDIISLLNNEGVVHGIDDNAIDKIVAKKRAPIEQVVAKGTLPEKGEDAKLMWLADPANHLKPQIGSDGKADFKHLKQQEEVTEGQEILAILPSTKGSPGTTVTGKPILHKTDDTVVEAGENIRVSEDGLNFYATSRGYISFDGKVVSITNIRKIDGDVCFRTGNIKFNGTVHITGDVLSGFRVEATDNIYIDGNVEAAEVYSLKGDIIIGLGVLGKGRAKIVSGNNFFCGFVQDASISVKNDIQITHYSINSEIYAGGSVHIEGAEGLIRGGKIFGERGVFATEAGSPKKIPTDIGISGKDFIETDSQILDLMKKREKLESDLFLINKRKTFLELLQARTKILSDEKQNELNNINDNIQDTLAEIKTINELRQSIIDEHDSAKVNAITIFNNLYKGVTVSIGHLHYPVDNPYSHVKIYRNVNEILFEKMQESESIAE